MCVLICFHNFFISTDVNYKLVLVLVFQISDGEIIGSEEVNLLHKMLKSSGIQSLNGREYLTYEEVQVVLYDELALHVNIKENLKSSKFLRIYIAC